LLVSPDQTAHFTSLQAIVVDLQKTGVLRALFQQEEAEAAAAEGQHKAGGTPAQAAGDEQEDSTGAPPDAGTAAQCAASADSRTGKGGAAPQANGGAFQRLTSSRYVDDSSLCQRCTTAAAVDILLHANCALLGCPTGRRYVQSVPGNAAE
jgi:hypothetical protein